MKEVPRFSFLTSAYRTERFLRRTIDSVVAQTCPDWELVVVDNGNSDAIAAIVEEYAADARIKLIRQENRGYVGGVMAAAGGASGRYLCVLDSDDLLMPNYCTEVNTLLDSDPTVDAVGVDASRMTDDGPEHVGGYLRSIGVKTRIDPNENLVLADVLGGLVPYYTAAVRREAWDAVGGFDPGIPDVDESVVFWLRIVCKYNVRVLTLRLACYRLRSDSLSRDPANVDAFEAELERAFNTVEPSTPVEADALDATLRRIRYWKRLRQARSALLTGDDRAARNLAADAFAQRQTLRSVAVLLAVTVAPGVLRWIHPLKQRAEEQFECFVSWVRLRSAAAKRSESSYRPGCVRQHPGCISART
jgi:glycosyltransferase involved in cell wall biosynthesis